MPAMHLNLNVRGMRPSATVALNERCNDLLAQGREIFKLGLGQSPFPVPDVVADELRANAHQKDYLPVKGLRRLREVVAAYHHRRDGVEASADDVLIGPGSKELMFLLQLVYYGDLVIPTPAWVSYAPQARIIGRRVDLLATERANDWLLTPQQLQAHCAADIGKPRILVLNYPSNPTGGTYAEAQLQALAEVARSSGVIVLSDEIYGETHHRGEHLSISRWYPEGTIISSGLSKWCGAGGWRLGTFTFPGELRWLLDAMAAVASETYTSTSAPIQYGAVAAFLGNADIDTYLLRSRRLLSSLGQWAAQALNAAGIDTLAPQGGFYLFADFGGLRERLAQRGLHTSPALCEVLLEETGVAILPGEDFGRPPQELTARLAYVDFDGAGVLQALAAGGDGADIDLAFLEAHCPRVVTAIQRICSWSGL